MVVMGGSFNPPTLAHHVLMRQALDKLQASRGIYVPVSDAYLRRKMRNCHPPVVLPPVVRIQMLHAMCTESRMTVCTKEMGTVEARTLPTLTALQEENPEAEIYFLMGADKLELLTHLTRKWAFLQHFRVALYARNEEDIAGLLEEDEVLAPYRERIAMLPQPADANGISSSKVRERMLAGISCQDMLCPEVWLLFKDFTPDDFPDTINRFQGSYSFLSNRYACQLEWQGLRYENAEAAFQSSKLVDVADRKVFCRCGPDKAAQKGNQLVPPPQWEDERLGIMESIVEAKFAQHPELMQRLCDTAGKLLIHGNSRGETFWGIDLYSWQGENHLGKILMNIRKKFSKKPFS